MDLMSINCNAFVNNCQMSITSDACVENVFNVDTWDICVSETKNQCKILILQD